MSVTIALRMGLSLLAPEPPPSRAGSVPRVYSAPLMRAAVSASLVGLEDSGSAVGPGVGATKSFARNLAQRATLSPRDRERGTCELHPYTAQRPCSWMHSAQQLRW